MLDKSTLFWIVVLSIGLLLLPVLSKMAARKREHSWKTAARRLKLKYFHRDGLSEFAGHSHGHHVRLAESRSTSDTEGGVIIAIARVQVSGVPPAMEAEWSPGHLSELSHLTDDHVMLGIEDFDQQIMLLSKDYQQAKAYWTDVRRQAFLELANPQNGDKIVLSERGLVAERRGLNNDLDDIVRWIEALLKAAIQLSAK